MNTSETLDLADLRMNELLAVGRRAMELGAHRFEEIAQAAEPADQPLQELLQKMANQAIARAASVEDLENQRLEESRLASYPERAMGLIRRFLTSLSKRFGETPLDRDIALFLAESLEEELSRFYRILAEHARESWPRRLLLELSERERGNLHYLREVVLQG